MIGQTEPPAPISFWTHGLIFIVGAGITFAFVPLAKSACARFGWIDHPGHRKIHATPVPLAGGMAIFLAMVVVLIGALALTLTPWFPESLAHKLVYGFSARAIQLIAIGAGSIAMLVLGLLDDFYVYPPRTKLLTQMLVATLVVLSGIRITFFVEPQWAHFIGTVAWILFVITIININDNMNGLCAGLSLIAIVFFALKANESGQYLVSALAALTSGAIVGFLPYNYPKASVFLGDSGSHFLGFLVAILSILTTFTPIDVANPPSPTAALAPLLILIVPSIDFVQVLITRTLIGRPIWEGDTNHLSHRLTRLGLSTSQAVALLWTFAFLGGLLAMAL